MHLAKTVIIIHSFVPTGVINGALPFMRKDLDLTDVTVGIVTSSLLIGAAFGAFLGGKLADKFGRRRTLIVLSVMRDFKNV